MKLHTERKKRSFASFARQGYLLKTYMVILFYALRKTRFTRKDLSGLVFLLVAPLMYFSRMRTVKSPIGLLTLEDQELFRSIVYGFFKTHFCYLKYMASVNVGSHFSVIVDVGANIGDFAMATSRMADVVLAIEPGKRNFINLKENLELNGMDNILPLNIAATDSCKTLRMEGNTSDLFVSSDGNGEDVVGLPLDKVCGDLSLRRIDVLKLDVQGHELSALAGMYGLLREHAPKLVMVEVHLKRGVKTADVARVMRSHGYRLLSKTNFLFDQPHMCFMSANRA